ncbi:MAG: hypothetical protein ABJC26_10665 [Gemmatimonadaceae bacterium]
MSFPLTGTDMRSQSTTLALLAIPTLLLGMSGGSPLLTQPRDLSALNALVGEWQSDTVSGISAGASCAWTEHRSALVCEQRISSAAGTSNALNIFTADSIPGQFTLYPLSHPGRVATPVPIIIRGTQWFYGGSAPDGDGRYYRTVNDFSQADVYTWRQETSPDGKQWTAGIHGQSRRVR